MFIRFDMIHERDRRTGRQTDGRTDGRTDGHCMTAIAALMHSIARQNVLRYQMLQHEFECCLSALTQLTTHNLIALPMIRRSKSAQKSSAHIVSSRCCCYGNHTAGLSQFKNFLSQSMEN